MEIERWVKVEADRIVSVRRSRERDSYRVHEAVRVFSREWDKPRMQKLLEVEGFTQIPGTDPPLYELPSEWDLDCVERLLVQRVPITTAFNTESHALRDARGTPVRIGR